jgi:hypothetical protein
MACRNGKLSSNVLAGCSARRLIEEPLMFTTTLDLSTLLAAGASSLCAARSRAMM